MYQIFLNQILQDQGRSREVPPNKQDFQEVLYRLVLVKALDIKHQTALSLLKESMLQPKYSGQTQPLLRDGTTQGMGHHHSLRSTKPRK